MLDVSLVHTLAHERLVVLIHRPPHRNPRANDTLSVLSVVCCVHFSADGKYLATGCNRTAQIYDTETGAKTRFDFLITRWPTNLLALIIIIVQRLCR